MAIPRRRCEGARLKKSSPNPKSLPRRYRHERTRRDDDSDDDYNQTYYHQYNRYKPANHVTGGAVARSLVDGRSSSDDDDDDTTGSESDTSTETERSEQEVLDWNGMVSLAGGFTSGLADYFGVNAEDEDDEGGKEKERATSPLIIPDEVALSYDSRLPSDLSDMGSTKNSAREFRKNWRYRDL